MSLAWGLKILNKCFFAQISSMHSKSAVEKWVVQKEEAGHSSTPVTVKYKLSINRSPATAFSIRKGNTVIFLSDTYGQILLSVQNWSKIASEYQTEDKGTTQDILI